MRGRATGRLAGALALFAALAGCGGEAPGDWRAQLGRPEPNALVLAPLPPLAIPPTLALPPPRAPATAAEAVPGAVPGIGPAS